MPLPGRSRGFNRPFALLNSVTKILQEPEPAFQAVKPGGDPSGSYRPKVATSYVRPIELLYYHDYEPADSDSSGEESVDEEPHSEDEWFIDDGPLEPEASEPVEDTPDTGASTELPKDDTITTSGGL